MKATLLSTALALAVCGLAAPAAAATLIAPDNAVASSQVSIAPATATIDGSGLSGVDETAIHDLCCSIWGNHWVGNETNDEEGFNAASITWGFAAPVDIGGVYIWNNAFYPVLGGVLEFFNAANALIGSEVLALTAPPFVGPGQPAEFFSFAARTGVSEVTFTLERANYAFSNFRGLSEVRFLQAEIVPPPPPPGVIPLPAGLPLLLGGLGLLALLRRRHA